MKELLPQLLKQVVRKSRRHGEIRAAKVLKYREVYANNLPVAVKERPARAAGGGRRVVHDFVRQDIADVIAYLRAGL